MSEVVQLPSEPEEYGSEQELVQQIRVWYGAALSPFLKVNLPNPL